MEERLWLLVKRGYRGRTFLDTVAASDRGRSRSYTRPHARLPELGDALAEELSVPRQECETRLGRTCRTIAYPYGSADGWVVAAAEAAGYVAGACPLLRLPEPSRLHWPRAMIYRKDDLRRFRAKVSPVVGRVYVSAAWGLMRVAGGRLGYERTHVS